MKTLESFVVFQDADVMRLYDGELIALQASIPQLCFSHQHQWAGSKGAKTSGQTTTPTRDRFLVVPPPATLRGAPDLRFAR